MRGGVPLVGREAVPPDCFGVVLRDAPAAVVHGPEVELPGGVAQLNRKAKPSNRLSIVLGKTFAGHVDEPEADLRGGESLVGCEPIPLRGLGIVLWDAEAKRMPLPEVELRSGVAVLSERPHLLQCQRRIVSRPLRIVSRPSLRVEARIVRDHGDADQNSEQADDASSVNPHEMSSCLQSTALPRRWFDSIRTRQ